MLEGRVALISGAGHSRGAAIARRFVAEGARVVVGDLPAYEAERLAAGLGPAARPARLDVTSEDDWAGAVRTAVDGFGRLDVLVNSAATAPRTPIRSTGLQEFLAVLAVNQVGTYLGMRAAVDALTGSDGGSIVNISSIDGLRGHAGAAAYVASKFAVRGMTKTAALEFGRAGIRVNSVHPGVVDIPTDDRAVTDYLAKIAELVPLGRLGHPDAPGHPGDARAGARLRPGARRAARARRGPARGADPGGRHASGHRPALDPSSAAGARRHRSPRRRL